MNYPWVWKRNISQIFQRNVRWKIFIAIISVILVSMFIMGTISFGYSSEIDRQNWKMRQEEVTLHTASLMDTHFENVYQYMDQISSLASQENTLDSAYLMTILENSPYFYEIVLLKPTGEIQATAWLDSPMLTNSFTATQSNWFIQAKSGNRYTSDLQIDKDGQSYIIIAQPTGGDEILAIRMQVSFFQSIVKSINFGKTGTITVLNESGEIMASTNYEYVLAKKKVPDAAYAKNFLTNTDEIFYGEGINFNDINIVMAAKRMENNRWLILTTIEDAEITRASMIQLLVYLLGFTVFGVLVILLLLGMLNHSIFSPLLELKKGTDYIAEGAYQHQIPIEGEDEFGRVAHSFNHMTQRIQQRDKSLLEEIESRERITQALKISQERYALAAKGSNDGIWDWNLLEDQVHYSMRWKSLLGYEEHEIGSTPEEWLNRIHKDDFDTVSYYLNQHLAGKSPFFRCEFRIKNKQDEFIWVSYRAIMETDIDGKPCRMAGSQTDITAQKEFEAKLHTAAYHDSLTGLPNRQFLTEKLKQILNHSLQESSNSFAVMFLDLDRFKLINDSFGHMKGDQLLIKVANLLKERTRPGDFVSRFGGDEFIIVMENVDNPDLIISEIQLLHQSLNEPFEIDNKQVYVGVSIGVAVGPDGYQNSDEIIRDADIALYQAKNLGLSHYVIFDPGMRRLAVDSLSIETDLRQALEKNQFVLFYQPIINLESMSLSGFEALIRWQHPVQGLMLPGDFVAIAEHTGLIKGIGIWVLNESLRQLAIWQKTDPALTMSINIAAQQIYEETLIENIRNGLADHKVSPSKFALEITESSVLEFDESTIKKLHAIKETGVKLYLDDFGTGYSSLNVLHKYPIDVIKIDQTFIREILQDRNKIEIAHTIVQLGSSLGMDVIAEGIENSEALQLLKSFQCPYGQGYYFHKPMPVQLVNKMLAEKDTYWKSVAHQPILKSSSF